MIEIEKEINLQKTWVELENIINEIYPNFRLPSRFTISSTLEGQYLEGDFDRISSKNPLHLFDGSKENDFNLKNTFIHYVPSIDTLKEILKTGAFWMNDLSSLNDEKELINSYSGLEQDLSWNFQAIEAHKEFFVSFSFCDYSIGKESSIMWNKYSELGKGCALVFNIEANPISVQGNDFYFGKISYSDNGNSSIKQLVKKWKAFNEEHSTSFNPIFLTILFAFNKTVHWSDEIEIRLIKKCGNLTHTEYFNDSNNKPHFRYYLPIRLLNGKPYENNEMRKKKYMPNNWVPTINLQRIIIGPNFKHVINFVETKRELEDFIKNETELDYSKITIEKSLL